MNEREERLKQIEARDLAVLNALGERYGTVKVELDAVLEDRAWLCAELRKAKPLLDAAGEYARLWGADCSIHDLENAETALFDAARCVASSQAEAGAK